MVIGADGAPIKRRRQSDVLLLILLLHSNRSGVLT
jgi:hypothetical protein